MVGVGESLLEPSKHFIVEKAAYSSNPVSLRQTVKEGGSLSQVFHKISSALIFTQQQIILYWLTSKASELREVKSL